jgi:hypothetical protein
VAGRFLVHHSSKKALRRWVLCPTYPGDGGVQSLLANKAIGRQEYMGVSYHWTCRPAIDMKMRPEQTEDRIRVRSEAVSVLSSLDGMKRSKLAWVHQRHCHFGGASWLHRSTIRTRKECDRTSALSKIHCDRSEY